MQEHLDDEQRTHRKAIERDGALVGALLVGDLGLVPALEQGVREGKPAAGARRCFRHALEAEKMHRELYERAKKAVDAGGAPAINPI